MGKTEGKSKILPCGRQSLCSPGKNLVEKNRDVLFEKLRKHVESFGLNHSDSREKIFSVILDFNNHFSISDIVRQVQKAFPNVGVATIYRNIPLYIEAGVLRESFSDKNGQPFYELEMQQHHDHIMCLDCNEIFEFHNEAIEKAQETVASKMNFQPVNHKHVIYARCQFRQK